MDLQNFINKKNSEILEKKLEAITLAEKNYNQYKAKMDAFGKKATNLENELKKLGLRIHNITTSKCGFSSDWKHDTSMDVSIVAKSTGKFKLIKDQGFDSRGRGKNQKLLDAKADKLVNALKDATGFDIIHVNSYSLEIEENETPETKSILINIYI